MSALSRDVPPLAAAASGAGVAPGAVAERYDAPPPPGTPVRDIGEALRRRSNDRLRSAVQVQKSGRPEV